MKRMAENLVEMAYWVSIGLLALMLHDWLPRR
jgi:hypothetical protein